MMNLFIDTEFNGFGGDLISMALVPDWCGDSSQKEFYEVLDCSNPVPWVAQNVMPVLKKGPISKEAFQFRLRQFLSKYPAGVIIHADWPDDIAYFCKALSVSPGQIISTPKLKFEIHSDLAFTSSVPHNALADACAIRDAWFRKIYLGVLA